MIQTNKPYFRAFFLLILPLFFLFFTACEEEPSGIGIDLKLPEQRLNVFFSDTSRFQALTFTQDSVRSDEPAVSLLGSMDDPVFGNSKANILTQIVLSERLYPGENAHVDSLLFIIKPGGFYGDENSEFNLSVFQSKTRVYKDSAYYSNLNVTDSLDINSVGSTTYLPGDSLIKIYLNPTFGDWLISDTSALVSQSAFQDHFNGFYVSAEDYLGGTGAVTYIDLLSAETQIIMYYGNSEEDSLVYPFDINTTSARINLFDHNPSTADEAQKIHHLDDNIEDTISYVQGMAGVYTKLVLPFFETWRDSIPMAVNQAQIIISLYDTSSTQDYLPANEYDLFVKNEDGQLNVIFDNYLGANYFGGTLEDGEISFNIATHLQDYLDGKTDENEFYLFVKSQAYIPNRSILTSSLNSKNLKFRLTYTRYSD
ncbi:MAG: DUF4270 family protein [Bacteroidales bacterium]|nr:DUF4270 family protein [Bacteroidales bacterium]